GAAGTRRYTYAPAAERRYYSGRLRCAVIETIDSLSGDFERAECADCAGAWIHSDARSGDGRGDVCGAGIFVGAAGAEGRAVRRRGGRRAESGSRAGDVWRGLDQVLLGPAVS